MILGLLKKAEELANKTRFISKDSIATGLGIDANLSKALVKKYATNLCANIKLFRMMESGYIDIRYVKNKGYVYVLKQALQQYILQEQMLYITKHVGND